MRAMLTTLALGLVTFTGLSMTNGCGTADEIFDCQAVCTRYRDCYQSDYDVDKCRNDCRTRSEHDSSVRSAANQCEACIGDKSCLTATFTCQPSCLSIVP